MEYSDTLSSFAKTCSRSSTSFKRAMIIEGTFSDAVYDSGEYDDCPNLVGTPGLHNRDIRFEMKVFLWDIFLQVKPYVRVYGHERQRHIFSSAIVAGYTHSRDMNV
jgi:hypothetical protein